jgi:hypothetical protein
MVYINENSGTVTIPKHIFTQDSTFTLLLTSNLSNDVVLVKDSGNISTNTNYYKFALGSLDNLNVGEYTYKLFNEDSEVIETGLLMFGNLDRTVIVNNTFNKEKIQYNG